MGDTSDQGGQAVPAVYEWYQEGRRRLEQGNARGAVEVLELAVEREPHKASLHEALARAYYATARVRLARAEFAKALKLNPTDDYAYYGVGRCHERLGDLRSAAKYLKMACAMSPKAGYRDALDRVETRLS